MSGATGVPAPAKSQDSTLAELKRYHTDAKNARQQLEPDWYVNLAYFAGQHWVYWDGGQLKRPKLRKDRILLVDNRIQPAVRRAIAKETKTRPTFEVSPTTMLDDDIYAALFGELAMTDIWHRLYLSRRLRTALKWKHICGAGFWKIFWDSEVGAKGEVLCRPDGQMLLDQHERPIKPARFDELLNQMPPDEASFLNGRVVRKTVREGEVGVEVRSPFQIAPDPLAPTMDEAEWVIEETVKSVEYVKTRYDVEGIRPDAEAVVGIVEGSLAPSSVGTTTSDYKGIKIKEFWARPCATYPEGKYAVWAGDKLLREENHPYERLPYVMFEGIGRPDRFWPESLTGVMRGPNTELNKAKSQVAENRTRIGNPMLLVSKQAQVKYSGVPGERVEFDDTTQNARPQYLEAPNLPPYVQAEIQDILASLAEASGQNAVSSAQVPAGVTAAAAIQLLQEADDTMVGPDAEDMETQLSHAGEMVLEQVSEKYTTARKMRIAGPDGEPDIIDFTGAMLRNNTRVRVRVGSTMPQSKAARKAEMMQALTLFVQNGVPLGERNLRRFFQEYDAAGLEAMFGDLSADERQIHREHRLMDAGNDVQVSPDVDNNEAHIAGHQDRQKSWRFQQLDPGVRAIHQAHLKAHLALRAPPPMLQPGGGTTPDVPGVLPGGGDPMAALGGGGAPAAPAAPPLAA